MANMGANPTIDYSTLHRHVLVDVTGPSEPVIHQEIQKAASKFIRISECWRETLDLGNLSDGYVFDFPKPTNGLSAGNGLDPQDPGYVAPDADYVQYDAYPKVPLRWVKIDGIEVKRQFYRVNPPSNSNTGYTLEFLEPFNIIGSGEVTVRLSWSLRFDFDPAPEWIYSQYGDIIANLCRGAFLTMVDKPWSSKDQGMSVMAIATNQAFRVLAEQSMADPVEFRP